MCRHVQTDLTLTWENKNMWSSGSLWGWIEVKESSLLYKRITVPIIFKKSLLLTGNMDHWGISRMDWQQTSTVSAGRGEIMKGRWSVFVCLKDSALLLQVKSFPHHVEVNEAQLFTVCHTKQVNWLNSYIMAQEMSVSYNFLHWSCW